MVVFVSILSTFFATNTKKVRGDILKRIIIKRRIVVYRTQRIVSLRDDDGIDGDESDDGDDKSSEEEEAY